MKTRSFLFTFIFMGFGLFSCSTDAVPEEQSDPKKNARLADCAPDVVCTEMFAAVSATIKYTDGSPVKLDKYQVIKTSTGADNTPAISSDELDMYRNMGVYLITNDNYRKELRNQQQEVEFIGHKDGKELVRRKFTIGADCCHVMHIDGELEITIEK
ncbi:hypothetical protein GXP67_06680 [Rhodocytophaga rosea]|uniref:Lipoprotein n=1 Tax=Rhodocytophaga rosea TaxID=2704465 RepID=A0A6C0GEF8_9BACT|nr:hypothetical protein [Rhodocytophaga rosea]QHT66365.1 hypothetical protein GXP67_06680 [Rhodocytophaga rosea]